MARTVTVVAAGLAAAAAISCSDSATKADGPRKHICGTWIGRAMFLVGDGPWYARASSSHPPTILESAGVGSTWLQIGSDCSHGQSINVTNPSVVSIIDSVNASDGRAVAVLVQPKQVGSTALTVAEGRTIAVFDVTSPPVVPTTGTT